MKSIIETVSKLVAIREADFTQELKQELVLIRKFVPMFLELSQELINKGIATKIHETMVNPRENTGISLSVTLAGTSEDSQSVIDAASDVLLARDYVVRKEAYPLSGRSYVKHFYNDSLGITIFMVVNGIDYRLTMILIVGDGR